MRWSIDLDKDECVGRNLDLVMLVDHFHFSFLFSLLGWRLGLGMVVGNQCSKAGTWYQGKPQLQFPMINIKTFPQTLEPICQNVMTAEGVPLTCTGVAQVLFPRPLQKGLLVYMWSICHLVCLPILY